MKKLIIFAQLAEAKATLQATKAQAVSGSTLRIWGEGEQPCLYTFNAGWIVLSGLGVHAAQMCVAKHASLSDEVWNLGLAGSLNSFYPLGSTVRIESVGKYTPLEPGALDKRSEECLSFNIPKLHLETGGGKLISSDFPVHATKHRESLGTQWDLVDMEGYGIAYACRFLGKKCSMWKIVSDFASQGGRYLIEKYKGQLSVTLAEKVMENL